MARKKKEKKLEKKEKKSVKEKIEVKNVEKVVDGIIKTELGYNVVHNGIVEKEHFGSNSFKVATKDYSTLAGV